MKLIKKAFWIKPHKWTIPYRCLLSIRSSHLWTILFYFPQKKIVLLIKKSVTHLNLMLKRVKIQIVLHKIHPKQASFLTKPPLPLLIKKLFSKINAAIFRKRISTNRTPKFFANFVPSF